MWNFLVNFLCLFENKEILVEFVLVVNDIWKSFSKGHFKNLFVLTFLKIHNFNSSQKQIMQDENLLLARTEKWLTAGLTIA